MGIKVAIQSSLEQQTEDEIHNKIWVLLCPYHYFFQAIMYVLSANKRDPIIMTPDESLNIIHN